MLDYKLVQAVATVVLEGGFEKAGRVLGLTQSAVQPLDARERQEELARMLGGVQVSSEARAATESVLARFFTGRIHHHVTTAHDFELA